MKNYLSHGTLVLTDMGWGVDTDKLIEHSSTPFIFTDDLLHQRHIKIPIASSLDDKIAVELK